MLTAHGNQCSAPAINLCEGFYDFFRNAGETEALGAIADLSAAGITERDDFDRDFWEAAGRPIASRQSAPHGMATGDFRRAAVLGVFRAPVEDWRLLSNDTAD